MEEIILVFPKEELEVRAMEFKKEFFDCGERIINGSFKLDYEDDYAEWLKIIRNNLKKETVNPKWVVSTTFFAVRKSDNKIIGIVNLRHYLNDFYKNSGHIGYSVRPSERRKGYASEILRQILEYAREKGLTEVCVVCKKENEASRKTILKNGGILSRTFKDEGEEHEAFYINTKKY
ncbi:acetyltransferase [Clostridium acetobutylicum]|nr:acetyltransferase [Clostridium acetobutylicum]